MNTHIAWGDIQLASTRVVSTLLVAAVVVIGVQTAAFSQDSAQSLPSVLAQLGPVQTPEPFNYWNVPVKIGVSIGAVLIFCALSYSVFFPVLLGAVWPRRAYGIASAAFWLATSGAVLALFWYDLPLPLAETTSWTRDYGLRSVIALQAIIIAYLLLNRFRSPAVPASK
jgi:hypothetical protein